MPVYSISDDDQEGRYNAKIRIDGTAICLQSGGGAIGGKPARNPDYSKALVTILQRLLGAVATDEVKLRRVLIDSTDARKLPIEKRLLADYAELDGMDAEEAAKLIRKRATSWGQVPGVKGGNPTRAIRFETSTLSQGKLRSTLKLVPWDGKPIYPIDRLTNSQQRKVTHQHIHHAVQRLLSGESATNFAESRDYDVRLDDGMRLAPKQVFGLALEEALGIEAYPGHFSAGWNQPSFEIIQSAGYRIVAKGAPSPSEVANALKTVPPADSDVEAIEGSLKLVSHFKRERSPDLSKRKKAAFISEHGRLFCERCGLEPREAYDVHVADSCIEVHHAKTHVKDMEEGHISKLEDLQCLCANCHRVTHRELALLGK